MRAHNEDILLGEKGAKDFRIRRVCYYACSWPAGFSFALLVGVLSSGFLKSSVWSRIKYADDNYHVMINDVCEHLKAKKSLKKRRRRSIKDTVCWFR